MLLKAREVAVRFNVARGTIYNWVKAGSFPGPVRIGPDTVRWREKDLVDFEAEAVEKRDLSSEKI